MFTLSVDGNTIEINGVYASMHPVVVVALIKGVYL